MRKIIIVLFISMGASQEVEEDIAKAQDLGTLCPNERCQQWQDENEELRNLLNALFFRYYDMKVELSSVELKLNSSLIISIAGYAIMFIIIVLKIYDCQAK